MSSINITIDDSSPSTLISYQPKELWLDINAVRKCSSCVQVDPMLAFNQTLHLGTHNATLGTGPPSTTSGSSASQTATADDAEESEGDHGGGKGRGGSGGGGGGGELVRIADRAVEGDEVVAAQFHFTGTAVYLFSILPQIPSGSSITTVNLTFTLDNQPSGAFLYIPSSSSSVGSNNLSTPVLALRNLPEVPHVLIATVAPGSIFLLDYMVYTTTSDDSSAQPTTTSASSHNNKVATFAGAIGGSLGVLALIALATFISIYYRRRKSAKRCLPLPNSGSPVRAQRFDDTDHGLVVADSSHNESSQPEMSYLPGGFPVTVIPREGEASAPGAVPPPYDIHSAPPPHYDGAETGRSSDSDRMISSPSDESARHRQMDITQPTTSVPLESPPLSPARTGSTTPPSPQFLNPQNSQRQLDWEDLGSHIDAESFDILVPPGIHPASSEASATSDSRSVYSCSTGTRLAPSVRS